MGLVHHQNPVVRALDGKLTQGSFTLCGNLGLQPLVVPVDSGSLSRARLDSYRKLLAEAEYQRRKSDPRAKSEAAAEIKTIMKSVRKHLKKKR